MVTLTLPYPISANRYWETRVMRAKATGRMAAMTYVSPAARQYKEQVAWLAHAAGVRRPLAGRVAVAFTLHPRRPLDWQRRERKAPANWDDSVQCIDLDNAQKVLLDALKGIVFEDDCWVRCITAVRGEPVDGGQLVVTITPWEPQGAGVRAQSERQLDFSSGGVPV